MIRFIIKSIFLSCLFAFSGFYLNAQTTVTFNEIPSTNSAFSLNGTNTYDNSGVRFQIFSGTNPSAFVSYTDNGFGGTKALDDTNTSIGGVTGWKIRKVDGSDFQFTSIWLQEGCGCSSTTGTVKAFKDNVQVGSTVNVTFNSGTTGAKNFSSNPDFYNIDEIRIEGTDLYVYIDNFSFGTAINPVDSDPPLVTSISLVGTPLTNATSVNYSVTFSKDAKNVSSDDFQLTTAGTAGTVGAVSGSGSSYTVAVNGIAGEGTIRLDLKGGTNIANVDDITGTPAFTSGQLHYVGACFVETFETETDASTTFSGNGQSFTLGTGLEIERRSGFGAGPSSGYVKNNNTAGSFSLSSATEFSMKTVDLFLSDQTNGNNPTATGSITITGKKAGLDQFTITKNSGFPTTTSTNNGFFTIDFATDGASNYRNTNVDELVFTISGGFIELAIDNLNFCEAVPLVDTQAPAVNSILKVGSPLSTAGSVSFQVTFDEAASNVSLDDFTLLKTGTTTGALTGISGSGSVYTLSVTGISSEGSLQIKLNAGTDIEDALGNTPPFEYLNGEIHLTGACYIETFESFIDGVTSFTSNGRSITLGGNWAVEKRSGFGIGSSSGYLENIGTGPYSLSLDQAVKFSKLALYLSSEGGSTPNPTNDGTVMIRGKNGATTEYTITKSTGFPTDFSSNNGFFYIDFATEGGADNSTTFVDGLEIEIGGSFIYLALENLEFCSDFESPTGYTVTIDQDPIDAGNASAISFTFADAEVGATYDYTFSTSGGATTVIGSGTIASATDQITGIDLSGLEDGTITLSVTLTDTSDNTGDPATDTSVKEPNNVPVATPPTAPAVTEDDVNVALADNIQVADSDGDDQTLTFTVTGGTVTLGTTGITFGGSGNGSVSFTAAGTLAALNTALDAATFTPTPNLFGTNAATIAFVANDGAADSNSASVTFDITGVNDDPIFTGLPASVTVVEDVIPSYLSNAFSDGTFADSDAGNNEVSLFLSVTSGTFGFADPVGLIGISGNGTATPTLTGTAANIESYLNINTNVFYNPPFNLSGTSAATISITANDGGNTGTGGGTTVLLGTIQINITEVNDDPTFTGLPTDITVVDGISSNIDLSAATFGDVDAGANSVDLSFLVSGGTLSATSGGGVTVSFPIPGSMTLSGTAANIESFLNTASTIKYTNAPGSVGDNVATLSISANDGGNTGSGGGTSVNLGTINIDVLNGPPSVTLSLAPLSRLENNAAGNNVTATLSNAYTSNVTVNLSLAGTATNTVDYSISGTSITILAGNTSGSVVITNIDDAILEGNETVIVDITGVTNGTEAGVQQATYTITDDDNASVTIADVSGNEDDGAITVTATLDNAVQGGFTVDVSTADGTATTADTDYTAVIAQTLTFAGTAGETQTFTITPTVDVIVESNETVSISMSSLSSTTAPVNITDGATLTINNDDFPPSGYSVFWDDVLINASEATNTSFTVNNAEVGATINYAISSSGDGNTATVSSSQLVNIGSQQVNANVSSLTDGVLTVQVTLTDVGGNSGGIVSDNSATLDQTAPVAPSTPDLVAGSDTGTSDSDNITSDNTPTFTGTAEANSSVELFADLTSIGTTTADGAGNWSLTAVSALADAVYSINAISTDLAGNEGPASGDLEITIDTDQPASPSIPDLIDASDTGVSATDNITADNTPTFNGTAEANSTITVISSIDGSLGTTTANGAGQWSFTSGVLSEGIHQISATATDAGNNTSDPSGALPITIDTQAPAKPGLPDLKVSSDSGISDSDNITNDVTPSLDGTAEANSTVTIISSIDGVIGTSTTNGAGQWSFTPGTDLSTGTHAVTVTAADLAGNTSSISDQLNLTIDTQAPTPIVIASLLLSLDIDGNSPILNPGDLLASPITDDYSATGNILLSLDKNMFDCTDVGSNPVSVTATDQAGNSDFAIVNVLVQDLIGPTIQAKPSVTLNVDAFSSVELLPGMVDEGSTDACGILSRTFSKSIFDRNDEGINNVNYIVTDVNGNPSQVNVEVTIVVVPKVLNIVVDPGQSKVYGDADPVFTFTATGFEAGDDESILTGGLVRAAGEDVGTYSINLGTLNSGPNYTINYTGADFGITRAALNVTADAGQMKVYGDVDPTFSYSASGFQNGDDESILTGGLARVAGEDVDTYSINLGTLNAGGNYTINYTGADFEITQAELTVTADAGQMKVYGDVDPTFSYSASGFQNGDDESILTGGLVRVAGEDVDTYAINLGTLDAGGNYTINYTGADFEITQATLTITADAGQTKVFGTADPIFLYTATGFKNGDTEAILTGALTRASGENIGFYAIELGSLSAGTNYSINFTSSDFAIASKVLNIQADAQTKVYGQADPLLTYTATGFEAGDDESILTGSLTRVAGEDVGTYTIQQGTLSAGANYAINFTGADFEITKANLNITADAGQNKVYGDPDPVFTYLVNGLKNGDTDAVVSGSLIRMAGEDVGSYAIQPGTLDAGGNYMINFISANFDITPATVSGITFEDDSFVFDGTAKSLAIVGTLPAGTAVAYNNNSRTDVGKQEVTATITGANFTTLELKADLTITPATVSGITFEDDSFVFDGTAKSLAIAGTLPAGTAVAYTNNSRTDVGTQEVTATITGANFTTLELKADLTITPATVSGITFEDDSFVFDGTAKSLTIAGTLPSGTAVAYTNNSRTDVGTQEVTANITGANFTTLELKADLTITPATVSGITFEDNSFVFDGTAKSLTIAGTLPAGTAVAYTNNSRTDVGSQEVTATITGANFTSLELKADLTITPATVSGITFEDDSFVFDGTAKSLAIAGTLPAGTAVAYTNNSRTDVGTQEVTATITGANFTTLELKADLTITPAILEIKVDLGQNKLFGQTDPILTYMASGFGVGDDESILSGTLIRDAGEAVGIYAIKLGSLDAGDNYSINYTGADFEIISNDTDGDGVPDDVEIEQGTDPTDQMDYKDGDGDDVPDYVEELEGSDPADPGDYKDSDGDDVPDYVEEQQSTDPNNPDDFLDEDEDGLSDYVQSKSISEIVDSILEVLWGIPAADLKVPTDVVVITAQGEVINLPVIWDLTGYDPMISGTTNYPGLVELPAGLFNPNELIPMLEITVLAKPAPQDVTLSANSFIGIPDQFFQEIGNFTVVDPSDNIHMLSLPEGVQDNDFFEVIDGILFWSSAEQAAGRTQFTILLRVTDRAGNVLEKSFQITRNRTPLDQLEVPNTFTPNNDGFNDTWGVQALRYYQGVRISIMDIGGNRIFYTENPDIRWDGTFEGKELPVGAYFWIIEVAETGEIRRGVLNLLRQ